MTDGKPRHEAAADRRKMTCVTNLCERSATRRCGPIFLSIRYLHDHVDVQPAVALLLVDLHDFEAIVDTEVY